MKTAIKTDLFKFVTLRQPQLISENNKQIGFVFYPFSNLSKFTDIVKITDLKEKQSKLKKLADEEKFFDSYLHLKKINESIYNFSSWLMKNRNILVMDEVEKYMKSVLPLSPEMEDVIWENLFYQIVSKKSQTVKQACLQVLVSNNFLKKNDFFSKTDDSLITDENKMQKLANAYIVIPRGLFAVKQNAKNVKTLINDNKYAKLSKNIKAAVAKRKFNKFNSFKDELISINKKLSLLNQKEYDVIFKKYQADYKLAIKDIKPVKDELTGVIYYPGAVLPELEFQGKNLFTSGFLSKHGSQELNNYINSKYIIDGKPADFEFPDYNEILLDIDSDVQTALEVVNENVVLPSTVNIGGNLITVNSFSGLGLYNYAVQFNTNKIGGNTYVGQDIDIHINVGYNNASINYAYFNIESVDLDGASNNIELISSTNTNILEINFKINDQVVVIRELSAPFSDFIFKGSIVLDNGKELSIEKTITPTIGTFIVNGLATLKNADPGDPTEPDPVEGDYEFYGIKSVGVADFRKVEQELCCYTVGEISHIENVLKNEYKEKSTRRLLSSESSTEETSETETEKLKDTTTTERNELQTEITKVLNEDKSQSYNASAGVRGSFEARGSETTFNADTSANFASSTSQSNSNSTAQTYAQEITERALERIVSKVSTKRISRILNEFEENNKHGFDNRGADSKHFNGVYRWVDKIYTNRLVNYGRRLTYEFMIPEPARFFLDAIKINNVVASTPEGLIFPVAPQSPSLLGLKKPGDISVLNYQLFASYYNAEINPCPEEIIHIGKAFSYTTGDSGLDGAEEWDEAASGSEELEIPDGYFTIAAKVNSGQSHEQPFNEYAKIIVGDKYCSVPSSPSGVSELNLNKFTQKIPISFSHMGHHSGNVNVDIECKLLPSTIEKWKNETFNTIMEAYNERVKEYNDFLYANNISSGNQTQKMNFNPLLNRALEKRELKRNAIEILTKVFGIDISKDHYISNSLNLTNSLNEHAKYVKFLEQSFDWELMAYIFYPYYYSDITKWKDLIQNGNGDDPIFSAFLQSGMARMVVPVKEGFENHVLYYLETGEVFEGEGLTIENDGELYVSIADELLPIEEGTVEKEWQSKVPTSLNIIQLDPLDFENGKIVCCNENGETVTIGGEISLPIPSPEV